MTIYENDFEFVAQRIAFVYLCKYLGKHPELEGDYEVLQVLYKRAFLPKAQVKVAKRCQDRGHELVRGKNPVERLTVTRWRDRFLRGLVYTIKEASERLETQH